MRITSASHTTQTRTWLLIAALPALLIGIGALIGGMSLYLVAALACATELIAYLFLARPVLAARRAKPVKQEKLP